MQNRKEFNKIKKILKKVKRKEPEYKNLTDDELKGMTEKFKSRYNSGESLDSILPDAFAAIIEADERVLGKRPYDVQKMAGIAMHRGLLCEMNTGEGKTLSATMPLYLNALTGKSCFLVTTNDYLANRDGTEMGEVYNFMGLSCSFPKANAQEKQNDDEKRQMYAADIVYVTNSGLGFDYLFNNLVKSAKDRFMRELHFAIVDEADSVLLDSAVMPLVVAGVPRVKSNLYELCDFFVTTLEEDLDYEVEDKAVWLTPRGVQYAEKFFGIPNFYGKENFDINRHVTIALRAHYTLFNQKDYTTVEGKKGMEVQLFDKSSGRLLTGVKLRGGQHQAIEAKEKVEITQENRTVASVTFQNLFLLFDKLAGMSGTVFDAKDELYNVYHKKLVKIPTNRPIQRVDRPDKYYPNGQKQFWAALDDLKKIHATGQPVLVVLNSVTDTDIFSRLLIQENIPHNVLNANNAFWEAQIISGAGQLNAVTVATTMAGRGTDIKLGEGVKELGGLAVLGVGRMDNVRNERQARGRSGRQGDPGFSQFYISLEDDIVGEDTEHLEKYIDEKRRISKRKIKKIVNGAQKYNNETAAFSRARSVQYDEVLKKQRDLIYQTRENLLMGENVEEQLLLDIANENVKAFLDKTPELTRGEFNRYILDNLSYSVMDDAGLINLNDKNVVEKYLMRLVKMGLTRQKMKINDDDTYQRFVREATLSAVDDGWVELIDYLEQLQAAVSGRASAQRNVVYEYQNEAFSVYKDTERVVKDNIIRNILLSDVSKGKEDKLAIIYP